MEYTSITVSKKSIEEWECFKNHSQESFESMINRILKHYAEENEALLTEEDVSEIELSVKEIKEGKFKTLEQMKTKYGM